MEGRSDVGIAGAVSDGIARVASAPAVLAGALALTIAFAGPGSAGGVAPVLQYAAVKPLLPFASAVRHPDELIPWMLGWAFLSGGILDRYARRRPTRGRGFFGACGAHLPALLRLAVLEWLVWLALSRVDPQFSRGYVQALLLAGSALIFLYARVRLVVEDRRSALGSLLAGARFVRRNPASVALFVFFTAAIRGASRVPLPGNLVAAELLLALLLFLIFESWASAIALFQGRLAHASYTAGPPLQWPESPAAEAISNLSPSARS